MESHIVTMVSRVAMESPSMVSDDIITSAVVISDNRLLSLSI